MFLARITPLALLISAVQIGTANFYDPQVSTRILDALPSALAEAGVSKFTELVGTLRTD